jgi:catalase (peroxidase I)
MKILLCISLWAANSQAFSFQHVATGRATTLRLSSSNVEPESASNHPGRRAFLLAAPATVAALSSWNVAPAAAADLNYKNVAADIAKIVQANPDWGPTLVRLAWHSSGTYDKMSKDGGSSGGTIRFKEELAHGGNAGLGDTAVQWMEPIHAKYAEQGLSYADLYTLGGGT